MGPRNGHVPEPDLAGLYAELLPVVFGFCRARLPHHDAEDVTAEVFGAAAEALRHDPDAALTRSWFLTVARNRIVDRWRRSERWRPRLALVAADLRTFEDDRADERGEVFDALDRLAPAHRAVLVLYHVEGRRVREIAEILQRSPRAVESLLVRARRALLEAVDAAGSGLTEAGRS